MKRHKKFEPRIPLPPVLDMDFIHTSPLYKPDDLLISDLYWKLLIDNVIQGENTLLAGYTGSAKSTFARAVAEILSRPFFKIPLGASQDASSILKGNNSFKEGVGTIFKEAEFVRAIKTPNAVILLDEFSRCHPDVENILMTVTDDQGYLRLDDSDTQETVYVADGVTFIATANFGNTFTTARVIDRASHDRFDVIEMKPLNATELLGLLKIKFPNAEPASLDDLSRIYEEIKKNHLGEDSKLTEMVSVRMVEKIARKLERNFTIQEIAEITIYPLFSEDGGTSSERAFVKTIVETILPDPNAKSFVKSKISKDNYFAKQAGVI